MLDDWQNDAALKTVMDKISFTYEASQYLGGGGMSKIYQVYHKGLNKIQILKIMDFTFLMNIFEKSGIKDINAEFNKIKDRFRTEAKIYWEFASPNIVEIFDFGFAKSQTRNIDIPYLIMEYIEGKTLKEILSEKGPLDLKTIFKISGDVMTTLDSIHQKGIIHRDIKPSNIMIRDKNQEVVILDFGIAKDTIANLAITDPHTAMGTLSYTSPEMLADSKTVTLQTDIYSFGIVLYEMITGELPFRGSSPEVLLGHLNPEKRFPKNPRLTRGLDRILKKAMAKDPLDRFKSAKEFSQALQELEKEIEEEPKFKYLLYISTVLFLFIAAFFFLKSYLPERQYDGFISSAKTFIQSNNLEKADEALKKARELKGRDTTEIKALLNDIKGKRIAALKEEFDTLNKYLASGATNKEKVEKCHDFLDRHQNTPGNEEVMRMLDEVNVFIFQLKIDILNDEQYQRKNGETQYAPIKDKVNLNQYLAFKRNYPNSIYLKDLRAMVKAADKNLPPDKYWDKPIIKNGKGYYELTFGSELNGHQMIYIPEKKIWIDKYEVSWAQFKKFLQDAKIQSPPIPDDKIINSGDTFPAVITYEYAQKYCQYYGLRLPSAEEWEYAAGKGNSIYPWGNVSPDEKGFWRANFDSLEGTVEKDGFEGTAPVKSFEKYSSPFGAVNMAGNVWEWIQGNILKGGGFFSSKEDLKIKNFKRGNNDKEGFRCVKLEK